MFHHQRHLKEPSLSMEVGQGPPSTILHDWRQNFAVVVGRRTWSICKFNVASFNEVEWVRLKETFFAYFLQYKEEALGIKERCPIDYMAYIEDHFFRAMGLHLEGLRSFTAWIKQGSYYHGLVARQGRLHECLHLAGFPLPRWPQVMPSESRQESQMKAEATATSFSKPGAGATAALAAETTVMETPIAETLVVEAPVSETSACSDTSAPMETGGVGDGQNTSRLAQMKGFRGLGPQNAPGPNPGGVSQNPCFPSPSKTVRGGSPLFCSSMSMRLSSLSPTTMWQVEESCISIWRCCHKRPGAWEIRLPA